MRFTLLVLSLVLFSGCALFGKRDIKPPKVDLDGVEVQSASFDGAQSLFALSVDNPNPFELKVDSVTYDVELGGKHLSTEKIDRETSVAASSKEIVKLPLTVKFSDLFQSIGDFLKNQATTYRIKGKARIGILTLPFDEKGELKLKKDG